MNDRDTYTMTFTSDPERDEELRHYASQLARDGRVAVMRDSTGNLMLMALTEGPSYTVTRPEPQSRKEIKAELEDRFVARHSRKGR